MELNGLDIFDGWEAVDGTPSKEVTFPQLDKLVILWCPQLSTLPEAPMLNELNIYEGNQQISLQAAGRYIISLSSLVLELSTDDTKTELVDTQNSSELVVHEKEKWNHKSPLEIIYLRGCNLLFSHPTALALWTCFVRLLDLQIHKVDVIVHWPEKVFQGLVSLRKLGIHQCSNLTGRTEACEQSTPAPSELLPRLESLVITDCESFVEVPRLPASLKQLLIRECDVLESVIISQQQESTSLVSAESGAQPDRSEASSDAVDRVLPRLEYLQIQRCSRLEVLHLPPSIKKLEIWECGSLQPLSGKLDAITGITSLSIGSCESLKSLESCFVELPSLQHLQLFNCKSLVSLPEWPQAYSSLKFLEVTYCAGIKLLPPSLQQHLGDIEGKRLDTCYEEPEPEPEVLHRQSAIGRLLCLK